MTTLERIHADLDRVRTADRPRLRRAWRQLRSGGATATHHAEVAELAAQVQAALRRQAQRQQAMPQVEFDGSLPIMEHRDAIATALQTRQTLVVAGETGSGKSTQLPKICLAEGFGARGLIGHTQPRRIAARTIAARLADELKVAMGAEVGYKIRFHDQTAEQTLVKLMTDGILLAETQTDRFFDQYEVIILDEAHERSLNIDFLLGYLKSRMVQRSDLKLIITSATIDAERFSAHFADEQGPAPIIEVSGRSYPVDVRYRPLVDDEGEERPTIDGIVGAIREIAREGRGDVLVFLPTERDIRETVRQLRRETWPGDGVRTTEILPLYARLSAREQNKIFQPSDYRRIVLATNVAESSLTVPGVRYVVDTGTARVSRYSPRSKIVRLPIEAVSRASADQRAGRCGRVAPGICIRLYSEDDYQQRDAYTTPEIRRTNLASVILQAKSLQLGEIKDYPFLDPPRPDAIRDGFKTLFEIQAIDADGQLTAIGRRLARMPVDPRIGRMILAGHEEKCLHEILIIAAVLEIQDPRDRPYDRQQQADERHERFLDKESDFIGYLKLWDFYHNLKEKTSRSRLRKACQDNFLSPVRMREWTEIHRQLLDVVRQIRLRVGPRRGNFTAIHRALLAGLLSGVAYRTADHEYTGAGGVKMRIWPGSGLFRERREWIVAAERVETSQRYARTVARISPTWVEGLAEHLVKRNYSDPHWSRKRRTVLAYEKVSLMGMPVVVGRKVPYGSIDAAAAREIFIQSALVDQRVDTFDPFLTRNRKLREEVEALAAKTRRRDFLLDDYSIFHFYDERVPPDVLDVESMRRWLRKHRSNRAHVTMRMEDLLAELPGDEAADQFPESLQVGTVTLPVQYNFSPGDEDDGVTLTVPAEAVNQLTSDQIGWLVPGLFQELLTALVRSLPKALRRNFVPVPDTVDQLLEEIPYGEGRVLEVVADRLSRHAGERVQVADFRLDTLPPHLTMNLRVVDADGQVQQMSRDLEQLRKDSRASDSPTAVGRAAPSSPVESQWNREGLTDWSFGELPTSVPVERGGIQIEAFPAVVDRDDAVALRLYDTRARAEQVSRRGIARLYVLKHRKSLRSQVRWLPQWDETCVWAASVISADELTAQLQMRIAELAFLGRKPVPRDLASYQDRMQDAVGAIALATQEVTPLVPMLFQAYHQARLACEQLTSDRDAVLRFDVGEQLSQMTTGQFWIDVPWIWLQQFPRYLQAIVYRIDKWRSGGQARDQTGQGIVQSHWNRYIEAQHANDAAGRYDPNLVEYRWMIEELRVSLFAQTLGTFVKVSSQRMDKQWAKVAS